MEGWSIPARMKGHTSPVGGRFGDNRPWMTRLLRPAIFLFLSACSSAPPVVDETPVSAPLPGQVFVARHGWHTGFVIPADAVRLLLPELEMHFGDTPWLEFGWGDKAYYESQKVTSGLTLRAVLWPTESVVLVRAIPDRPDRYFDDAEVEPLCLDERSYALLLQFIEGSFFRDSDNRIVFSSDGKLENSQFFRGVGTYYLFNTCNTWTAKGLKSAGQDLSPAFKLQAGSVMNYLARANGSADARGCAIRDVAELTATP